MLQSNTSGERGLMIANGKPLLSVEDKGIFLALFTNNDFYNVPARFF